MARPETLDPSVRANSFRRRRTPASVAEKSVVSITFVAAILSILTTIGIVVVLFSQSLPFFREYPVSQFLSNGDWRPRNGDVSILPLMTATLMVTFGSALISVPLGLMVGIYLAEYAPKKVRNIIKPALELLAGVPTVVYGYFALTAVTPLFKSFLPDLQPFNVLSGAIVVGIMTLPLVSSLCEDSISAVPNSLREGALALGATKFETIRKVVLPAALSGIVASFILAISRAVGEVMAVAMAAGLTPKLSFNPMEGAMTMTAFIVNTAAGDISRGTVEYYAIFAVGLTLFIITLALNLVAQRLVAKYRQVYS